MDKQALRAIMISNTLKYSKSYLDFSPDSNLTQFIDDLSMMLAGVHAAVSEAEWKSINTRSPGYSDFSEIHKQLNILTENIMPVLIKQLEKNKNPA